MASAIESLVELQRILDDLAATERTHAQPPDETMELAGRRDSLRQSLEESAASRAEVESARRLAESEAEDARGKLARYQEQIAQVATQREYGALLKESDTATEHISELETSILSAMTTIEEATTAEAALSEELETVEAQYDEQHAAWKKALPELTATLEGLQQRRDAIRATLSPAVLRLFERLRERHNGDPLAGVVRVERPGSANAMWRCAVCNYSVRPQVVVQISTSAEIVTCDCGRQRIFYLDQSEG
jgi:uncharacterized protein